MILERKLAKRVLDRLVVGVARNAEHLVVVARLGQEHTSRSTVVPPPASRYSASTTRPPGPDRLAAPRRSARRHRGGVAVRLRRLGVERLTGLLQHGLQRVGLLRRQRGIALAERLARLAQRRLDTPAQIVRKLAPKSASVRSAW